jgi:predicted nucleotide-binding protein
MIRAIAWDDDPEQDETAEFTYMYLLREQLKEKYEIELIVERDPVIFIHRVENGGPWRFIITDLIEEEIEGEADVYKGYNLALNCRELDRTVPIFMITGYTKAVIRRSIKVEKPFFIFSKKNSPSWIAMDIMDTLRNIGHSFDPGKVFLIYGRNKKAPAAKDIIIEELKKKGIEVKVLNRGETTHHILTEILMMMNQCSVCIALCTPDDFVKDADEKEYYQPRQNVVVEMGMIAGIANGIKRLIILQRIGPAVEYTAHIPTDFSGILSLSFREENLSDIWDQLYEALKKRGVYMNE